MSEIVNILSSLGFNWHVALANFINFLIILFILNKFFFGKIGKVIEERGKVIKRGIKDAEEAKDARSHAEKEKADILALSRKEGQEIILEAEKKAQSEAESIRHHAEKEYQEKLKALQVKEGSLQEKIEKAFGEQAPVLVAKLYAKTLAKNMSEEDNNALIASMK